MIYLPKCSFSFSIKDPTMATKTRPKGLKIDA